MEETETQVLRESMIGVQQQEVPTYTPQVGRNKLVLETPNTPNNQIPTYNRFQTLRDQHTNSPTPYSKPPFYLHPWME